MSPCILNTSISCVIYLDVSISLEQSVYSVAEADGSVEVCAVLQGQLARDVNVELRTEGDTASEFIDVCLKSAYTYYPSLSVCSNY